MEDRTLALLTPAEMAEADRRAVAAGVPAVELMQNAGHAVAEAVGRRWTTRPVVVLCGPGNNGGDGFVAARLLAAAGWPVRVALLGERAALRGEAAYHAALWSGAVEPLSPALLSGAGLVVDALFGAGLSRPLEGPALEVVKALARCRVPVVAVDVPSGLDGATGQIRGAATPAALTVTFFRRKPGHLLLPGRLLCGEIVVADIGIPEDVLDGVAAHCFENGPGLWRDVFPWPRLDSHKYARGHAVVLGGERMTGAARLAARAAARAGAGLVTVAAPAAAQAVYATALSSVLVEPFSTAEEFAASLADARRNAILLGPGGGRGAAMQRHVLASLGTGRAVILDADALTVFEQHPETLFAAISGACVLTPHAGEFARVFGPVGDDKLAAARTAAARSGAVVLLKGADTVVAAPDGWAVVNANAPPELATAGSGDVLAGMTLGLLAQGMPPVAAACAAAWLHGETGSEAGPGLIADDLVEALPPVLRRLKTAKPLTIL